MRVKFRECVNIPSQGGVEHLIDGCGQLNPTPAAGAMFTATAYENATLFVPASSKELYETATGWKEFMHINTEFSGIDQPQIDPDSPQPIYNLHGQYMGTSSDNLPTGVYIIGGKKIFIQ